ncbi:MAG: hypothetical protein RLZZ206_1780 [Cyanobacteriota bacterium]
MPPPPSATYERLRAFIAERMRMSPINQPLLLMELLGRRSHAPPAGHRPPDPGTSMVGKVHLQRHHPLRPRRLWIGGRHSRRLLRSSRAERRRARRAAATVPPAPRCLPNAARRGGDLFAHPEACGFGHRSRHRSPISGSVKYRVLTRARGSCECCGAWLLLSRSRTSGPWRWITSSRRRSLPRSGGTRAAQATSATCRHSASPMPIQVRCFQRRGSWRPCRAITRISVPCSRK